MRPIRLSYYLALLFLTLLAVISYLVIQRAQAAAGAGLRLIADLEGVGEILLFVAFATLIGAAVASFRLLERRLREREAELHAATEQQQALFQERLRLATILESLNDAIIGTTLDGIVTSWNPAAERLYGYQPQEIIGKSVMFLVPEDEPEDVMGILNKVRQGECVERYEVRRKHKDGRMITVSLTVSPIQNENGLVTGAATIAHDVTHHKALERQAFRLAVEQENVRIISDFIRDTSHEFRTPLTIMQTTAYLLSRTHDPDKQQERMNVIQEQVKHLSQLIDQLQLMVLLEGSSRFDLMPVNVNAIVMSVSETFVKRANEKYLDVRLELQPNLPLILADAHQLQIALSSLVENAILYTPEAGCISIRTSSSDDQVYIAVRDNGVGIGPDDLPHIFERFYKVDKARPLNQSGMGLGLTMVKTIVEAHQGSIQVESAPGQGSMFTVELPFRS